MIADVLRDGVRQIEDDQRDLPEWYGDDETRAWIEGVKTVMTDLRKALDAAWARSPDQQHLITHTALQGLRAYLDLTRSLRTEEKTSDDEHP
jgi:hypothetical protein